MPDETLVAEAEAVDISAWLQADLTSPDTYFTDLGATEPAGNAQTNRLYLPAIAR